jgi:hypothetical protein
MRIGAKRMAPHDRRVSVDYRRAIANDPCWYCGIEVAEHVDHFFPLAKGGTDHWWNLRRACAACNHSKNARCGTWFLLRRGFVGGTARSVPVVAQASSSNRRVAAAPRFYTFRRRKVRKNDRQLDLFSDYGGIGTP